MALGFVDRLLGFLSNTPQCDALLSSAGAGAFCLRTFSKRYGIEGYQITDVALAVTSSSRLEVAVPLTERWVGSRDKRSDTLERWAIEYRVNRATDLGWVDCAAAAAANVTFAALALTGASVGGPSYSKPGPVEHELGFALPTTDGSPQVASYPLDIWVFGSETIDPAADLRRIVEVRRMLDGDPFAFRSLDDSQERRLSLYVQAYDSTADPSPLTQAGVSALFESADVLVAFSSAGGAA
jgi:hypothetical protein